MYENYYLKPKELFEIHAFTFNSLLAFQIFTPQTSHKNG